MSDQHTPGHIRLRATMHPGNRVMPLLAFCPGCRVLYTACWGRKAKCLECGEELDRMRIESVKSFKTGDKVEHFAGGVPPDQSLPQDQS